MNRLPRLLYPSLIAALLVPSARASEPCSPNTYLFNPKRSSAEWTQLATWVAVGVVVEHREKKIPYPNCGLKDRSKCEIWDQSELTVRVERYEKGQGPAHLLLVAEMCAPDPPTTAGGRYRFFGHASTQYAMYEPEPRASRTGP